MKINIIFSIVLYYLFTLTNQEDGLLKGRMISSDNPNLVKFAFDGRFNTGFYSEKPSNGWVGLYFLTSHIISRIEWGTNETDNSTYLLGIFEGGNNKNFEDAITLHMITTNVKSNTNNFIDIQMEIPFLYFRYVGPYGQHCKINNIKIYGREENVEGDIFKYYIPTNLPLLTIHSSSGIEFSRENGAIKCFVSLFNDNKNELKNEQGIFYIQGIEALNLYKKTYSIFFDETQRILNFNTASRRWLLIANYPDKTLIRNLISLEISRIFEMEYTISCHPVDLIVNGEYKGTYNLCEHLEISKNKINIEVINCNDISEPEISGGYLLEINGFAFLGTSNINSRKGIPISIINPNDWDDENNKITIHHINYIKEKFDEFEFNIYNNNLTNVDVTSFVKFFLIEEIIGNGEAFWDFFIYKKRSDDKFYFGPITENDMGFDNDIRVYPVNCKPSYAFNFGLAAGTADKLINQILKNEDIIQKIKDKWIEKRQNLNLTRIYNYINNLTQLINQSKDLNFIRWDILNKQVYYNPKIYGSYEEEIKVLKNCIKNRIDFLNNYILETKAEKHNFCDVPIPSNNTKNSLEYEMDEEEQKDELNYQLLSSSYKNLQIIFFKYLSFIYFILL